VGALNTIVFAPAAIVAVPVPLIVAVGAEKIISFPPAVIVCGEPPRTNVAVGAENIISFNPAATIAVPVPVILAEGAENIISFPPAAKLTLVTTSGIANGLVVLDNNRNLLI
jgi:hypothetical protein